MKFFFDNNLPPRIARAVHQLVDKPHEAVHLVDKFHAPSVADVEWLRTLGREAKAMVADRHESGQIAGTWLSLLEETVRPRGRSRKSSGFSDLRDVTGPKVARLDGVASP